MLVMKPNCECCDKDLPAASIEARICSFECTFCRSCVDTILQGVCPNCGGDFMPRPSRVGKALINNPAQEERIYNPKLKNVLE